MDQDETYRAFGEAVAARRRQIGMTQSELADVVGLSRGSIAHIERGTQKVFLHQILGITDALGLDSSHDLVPSKFVGTQAGKPRIKIHGEKSLTPQQRDLIRSVFEIGKKTK